MSSSHLVLWKLFLTVFCVAADGFTNATQNQSVAVAKSSDGFGFELIQMRLDYLEHRFAELFTDLIKHNQRLEDELRANMSLISDQSRKILQAVDPMERYRFGGGWLVVMQRFDGSENFNRNWADYRNGFGLADQEFWLGLEKLHQLTKNTPHELLINMKDFAGTHRYARYSKFAVGSEVESYVLKELGSYSGTAGDSLTRHKGRKFSALDKGSLQNCAKMFTGGWWYEGWNGGENCYLCHLTGKWDQAHAWTSITWNTFGSPPNRALKFVRISIRKL